MEEGPSHLAQSDVEMATADSLAGTPHNVAYRPSQFSQQLEVGFSQNIAHRLHSSEAIAVISEGCMDHSPLSF